MIDEIYFDNNLIFKREPKITIIEEESVVINYLYLLNKIACQYDTYHVNFDIPGSMPHTLKVLTEKLEILFRLENISTAKWDWVSKCDNYIINYILVIDRETLEIIHVNEVSIDDFTSFSKIDVFKGIPKEVLDCLRIIPLNTSSPASYDEINLIDPNQLKFLNSCLPVLFQDSCEELIINKDEPPLLKFIKVKLPWSETLFPVGSMGSGFNNVFNFLNFVYKHKDEDAIGFYVGLFRSLHPLIIPAYKKFIEKNIKTNIITTK